MSAAAEHYRRLERMYHGAPANDYYDPRLEVGEGRAEVRIPVRRKFFHAAGAAHGSVCFKALDDACFFAAASLVEEFFVLTASFHLYFTRPLGEGLLVASARVVHRSGRLILAEGEALDGEGRSVARGSGSFLPSSTRLTAELGYR